MTEHGLGRIYLPDERDLRAVNLMATYLPAVAIPKVRLWEPGPVLDQGQTPECVAYATTAWEEGAQVMDSPSSIDTPDVLYAKAQAIDQIPLPHEGTTVRAAMEVMKTQGRLGRYLWAQNEAELWTWVMTQGPAVIGILWLNSMFETDRQGFVIVDRASGEAGGHAVKVYGGSKAGSYYCLQNSWGDWGALHGRFRIKRADMAWLLSQQGEACGAIEVEV